MGLFEFLGTYVARKVLDRAVDAFPFKQRAVPHWAATIERAIPDVRIYGLAREEPRVEVVGPLARSESDTTLAARLRPTLAVNDDHAVLLEEPVMMTTPVRLRVATLDYAQLEIARKSGDRPAVVTAGALVLCPKERILVFHHRSRRSRTFPDHVHVLGGAYQPPVAAEGINDGFSLRTTVDREVREEMNTPVSFDHDPPMLLSKEISEGFFQCVVLGAVITSKQLGRLRENWEGEGLVKVPFDELQQFLLAPPKPWVPTGKAHVLAWLALGAPGAGRRRKFGAHSPQSCSKHCFLKKQGESKAATVWL